MRRSGLELLVAADATALVDFQTGPVEVKGIGVAGAAHAEQNGLAEKALTAFQFDRDSSPSPNPYPSWRWGRTFTDRYDAFTQPEDHAQRAGMVEQRLENLAVAEFQQLCAAI